MKVKIELVLDDDLIDADYSVKDLKADIRREIRFNSVKLNEALLDVADIEIEKRGNK